MTTNIVVNRNFTSMSGSFPLIGVAVWSAIFAAIPVRRHDWGLLAFAVGYGGSI